MNAILDLNTRMMIRPAKNAKVKFSSTGDVKFVQLEKAKSGHLMMPCGDSQ